MKKIQNKEKKHEEFLDTDFPKDMGKQTSGNDTGAFTV
jgi:hypothetical protein